MGDKQTRTGFIKRWSARKELAQEKNSDAAAPAEQNAGDVRFGEKSEIQSDIEADTLPESFDEQSPNAAHPELVGTARLTADSEDEGNTPVLTDADMPPIESLSSDSDLSMFFSEGVSAAVKKAALRHVFMQPGYNVRDGLNDYDGDYTSFEPLGDTITSDMKWHTARKERERLEKLAREQAALEQDNVARRDDVSDEDNNDIDKEQGTDNEHDIDREHDINNEHGIDESEPAELQRRDQEQQLAGSVAAEQESVGGGKLTRRVHAPSEQCKTPLPEADGANNEQDKDIA